jgi:hypothetical protein
MPATCREGLVPIPALSLRLGLVPIPAVTSLEFPRAAMSDKAIEAVRAAATRIIVTIFFISGSFLR